MDRNILFKTILLKGETGTITSIEKTNTDGLVDTYTITYNDGATANFEITNGNGISEIRKTGTSGLVDTYTIYYDNGTSDTFDITNGNTKELYTATHTNLLNPTLATTTVNGVTCIANGDGTYTVTGAVSSGNIANFVIEDNFELPLNTPLMLVGCPKGGGTSSSDIVYKLALFDHEAQHQIRYDYGNGSPVYTNDGTYNTFRMHLAVYAGAGTVNLTFKPMITTDIYASYDEYVQYSGDGKINENVAKHEKDIAQINTNLTASDNLKFQFMKLGSSYGYKNASGVFVPFKQVQASKAVTASTSTQTVTPDSGYDGIESVTINPQPHTTTRATVTSNGTIDLGANHATRYVPINVGARLVGTYSANTTINISSLGATSASQFLVVCDTEARGWTGSWNLLRDYNRVLSSHYYPPSITAFSASSLTLSVGKIIDYVQTDDDGHSTGTVYVNLSTKVYFIG